MEANDNILVTKVWVTIMDEDGNMLEKGEGIRVKATGGGLHFRRMAR